MSADHMLRTTCVPTTRVTTRWWWGLGSLPGRRWAASWRWWA